MKTNSNRIRVGDHVVIYPRGKKKIYCADFWYSGEHRRRSLKTRDLRKAKSEAVILAASLAEGTFQKPPTPAAVRQAIEDYLLHLETDGRRPKTIVRYRGELHAFRDFLDEHRAGRLAQISPLLFDKFRALRKNNHTLKTLYHEGVVIKQFLKWCKSRRFLAQDPLEQVRLVKPERVPKPAFTLEQVDLILREFHGQELVMNAIAAFAGLREAQICLLRPQDADLRGDWIHIQPVAGAKTKQPVKVPIHPRLKALLQTLPNRPRPWLFTAAPSPKYPDGNHSVNPKRLYENLKRVLIKLGLPTQQKNGGYTFHSFRRFFRTFTTNAGVPREVVDAWMGHKSDRSMAVVYYDLKDDVSQIFMKRLSFGAGEPANHTNERRNAHDESEAHDHHDRSHDDRHQGSD